MARIFSIALLVWCWGEAHATSDPDQSRPVPEGVVAYRAGSAEAGGTYAGFLIGFPGRSELFLSPSRYQVSYRRDALKCRNENEFFAASIRNGKWWNIVFEVVAVIEEAIEEPSGSGNWGWKMRYDCIIKDMSEAS